MLGTRSRKEKEEIHDCWWRVWTEKLHRGCGGVEKQGENLGSGSYESMAQRVSQVGQKWPRWNIELVSNNLGLLRGGRLAMWRLESGPAVAACLRHIKI